MGFARTPTSEVLVLRANLHIRTCGPAEPNLRDSLFFFVLKVAPYAKRQRAQAPTSGTRCGASSENADKMWWQRGPEGAVAGVVRWALSTPSEKWPGTCSAIKLIENGLGGNYGPPAAQKPDIGTDRGTVRRLSGPARYEGHSAGAGSARTPE